MLKRALRAVIHHAGYEVRRSPTRAGQPPLPPMVDDAIEALYLARSGKLSAFACPLAKSRTAFGFGFGPKGWHPYAAVACEYVEGRSSTYEQSVLKRYFSTWTPRTAADVVIGFNDTPDLYRNYPPFAFVAPWDSHSLEDRAREVPKSCRHDYVENGFPNLDIHVHGYRNLGPASDERGNVEYARCTRIVDSIRANGYDRTYGDTDGDVVRSGSELLFMCGRHAHRRAAAAALGFPSVPAVLRNPMIVDARDVDYWPQVRAGVWSAAQALAYVDHLINFDSGSWAIDMGFAE